jgi:hypothetical protein
VTTVLAHDLMTLGTSAPRLGVDWQHQPSRYLTIDGTPAYQIAYSCGTCGLVLRRQPGTPTGLASANEVRNRLNAGLHSLEPQVIEAFAAQIPHGRYLVMLLDLRPRLVAPGTADDYFTVDGPDAWKDDEREVGIDPANTAYYRLAGDRIGEHDELFQFIVPMHDPAQTDPGLYRTTAGHPTAVALGLLDIEGPWFRRERHWGLFHFLLDGHHKTATAAATSTTLRLLTFVSASHSLATDEELLRLPDLLTPTG